MFLVKANPPCVRRVSTTRKDLGTIPDSIGVEVLEQSGTDVGALRDFIHRVYGSCCQRSLLSYLINKHKTLYKVLT
jgi:hypothetical protein